MTREPIYLCTMEELLGGMDEERGNQQFSLLAGILDKLGYRLASGEPPNLHELWAIPLTPAAAPSSLVH